MRELSTRPSNVCNPCYKFFTIFAGYGTYLEDPFSRNTLLSDPAFARMAAEYGATFQKTSVVRKIRCNIVARD